MILTPSLSIPVAAPAAGCASILAEDRTSAGERSCVDGSKRGCIAYTGTRSRVTPSMDTTLSSDSGAIQPSMTHQELNLTDALMENPIDARAAVGLSLEQSKETSTCTRPPWSKCQALTASARAAIPQAARMAKRPVGSPLVLFFPPMGTIVPQSVPSRTFGANPPRQAFGPTKN